MRTLVCVLCERSNTVEGIIFSVKLKMHYITNEDVILFLEYGWGTVQKKKEKRNIFHF